MTGPHGDPPAHSCGKTVNVLALVAPFSVALIAAVLRGHVPRQDIERSGIGALWDQYARHRELGAPAPADLFAAQRVDRIDAHGPAHREIARHGQRSPQDD